MRILLFRALYQGPPVSETPIMKAVTIRVGLRGAMCRDHMGGCQKYGPYSIPDNHPYAKGALLLHAQTPKSHPVCHRKSWTLHENCQSPQILFKCNIIQYALLYYELADEQAEVSW